MFFKRIVIFKSLKKVEESMGGGKRLKFIRKKFISEDKKLGKYVEEKQEEKKPEDVKNLLDLFTKVKKKESEVKQEVEE